MNEEEYLDLRQRICDEIMEGPMRRSRSQSRDVPVHLSSIL